VRAHKSSVCLLRRPASCRFQHPGRRAPTRATGAPRPPQRAATRAIGAPPPPQDDPRVTWPRPSRARTPRRRVGQPHGPGPQTGSQLPNAKIVRGSYKALSRFFKPSPRRAGRPPLLMFPSSSSFVTGVIKERARASTLPPCLSLFRPSCPGGRSGGRGGDGGGGEEEEEEFIRIQRIL